ncbi:MAG: hydrogenase maturation protease [Candidatus Heimdallarchaeota archaeon]|nr:hydrogenase maturation protease [Candidatus Heimdallarchaeota archaeon]MCG3256397.1 hydrogenase maturation protease [Candidatus Heimdallarchaeota archaeon]MCK4611463.1 hydrogenase maturation protease [Candidatus Heimdallarchaeota archaeon]
MKSVIIGLGNPIVGDDAIGIKVMERIRDTFSPIKNTKILADISIAGLGLVELIRGYDSAILVDSIQTGKNSVGTVIQLQPEEFSLASHTSHYHNIDIFTALEFSNQIYDDVPKNIKIIGIEIMNPMEFSDELSFELQNKFEGIVNQVYQTIIQELKEEITANIV